MAGVPLCGFGTVAVGPHGVFRIISQIVCIAGVLRGLWAIVCIAGVLRDLWRLIVSPISFTLSFFAFCFGHNHLPLTPEVLEGLCAQLGILRCVLDIRV